MVRKSCLWAVVLIALLPALSVAQQTGGVVGKVVDKDGLVLPGVTVEARSASLPAPRTTVTGGVGDFRLPALQPGTYTLTFDLQGMSKVTREVVVQLAQDTTVNVTMSIQGVTETVNVTAEIVPVIEKDSTALKSGVSTETIQSVPVGQEYRDLIKLIPGVQYTQDSVRGPSAGGSGQDNVYKFDGVNVTLPLFGTLASDPASHDIAQVTTIKGGAKAVDFDRAGGFTVDSISKSGTASFSGLLSYKLQNPSMSSDLTSASLSQYKNDLGWLTANLGGPILKRKAYFYGSYYRPTQTRNNASNVYGSLPGYNSVRNEGFGKITVTPISQILLNVSYRDSHRLDTGSGFGSKGTNTSGSGSESWQRIAIVEGSWVINSKSYASFKYTHFGNPGQGRPDYVSSATVNTAAGTQLDVNNLDKVGQFSVPTPVAGETAYNAFIAPIIAKYGYTDAATGQKTGSGTVGYYYMFDQDDFYRDQAQAAYNISLGGEVRHDIHAGVQWYVDSEDLKRSSNGWGLLTVPGGRLASASFNGVRAYYQAQFFQQTGGLVPPIHSEYRSVNFEINDTVSFKNVSVNFGVVASRDTLYGQGLREDPTALSGYVKADGNKYTMYTIPFAKTLQPRVGATWSYNGTDTIYGSFARYVPAASSLPRAASWGRNLAAEIYGYFDQNGSLMGVSPLAGSSGKLFQPNMAPRQTDEYLVGTAKQFAHGITGRLYYRYRAGSHFWEDTNNTARVAYAPPAGIPRTPYIPDLTAKLNQIGSGSTYVIAELDGAYTKYHEATVEAEWRTRKSFVRLSYSWTRYRGNFDQDNTTSGNDSNVFIGSSFIGDGAGRQLWNFRDGTLRGDRPMSLKLYGYYQLPWWASVGAYAIAQSGQPWEKWSYEPYIALTTSTSDASRYAEPAGSRRTDTQYQMDLNYTQDFRLMKRYRFQVVADLFNVFNAQTGYNIDPAAHSSTFGQPRSFLAPRRAQISAKFQF